MPPVAYPRSWSANDTGFNTVIIGNRSEISPNTLSSGSFQSVCYRVRRFTLANTAVFGPRLVFANMGITTTGEVLPADAWTIKATIELADGRLFPVFFQGGRTSGYVQPGAHIVSDPVGIVLPAASHYFVRTWVSVDTAGKKWVTTNTLLTALGEGFASSDFTDTATGSLPAMASAATFGPVAVIGTTGSKLPVVAIVGSSSAAGQGDTAEAPYYDNGYLSRILSINVPHLRLGRASDTIQQFLAVNRYRLQLMAATGVTHVVFQSGSNDLSNGASVETMKTRLMDVWTLLDSAGFKVIQSTLTQTATGTFASEETQTANADADRRAEVNAWIRSCPAPLHGVVDPAAIVAGFTNPKIWRADGAAWTSDGTHLTQYGHRQVAALMQAELLNILY